MNDVLSSTLEHLRLEGALFFRSELTEPFEFESSPLALADALVPGADRLTLFHIVASGSCWVALDDGVRYWADTGDVIVMRGPLRDGWRGLRRVCVDPLAAGAPPLEGDAGYSAMVVAKMVAAGVLRSCAATCTAPIRCSTRRCGRCPRCSWCACRAVQRPVGSRRASTTRWPRPYRRRTGRRTWPRHGCLSSS
jgi:Cupin